MLKKSIQATKFIDSPKSQEEDDEDFLFDQPETDEAREKFEVIGIKMDLHKNGILYLKELQTLLDELSEYQREPVAAFCVAYMRQTKKVIIKLPVFVDNIMKAYERDKFNLSKIIEGGNDLEEEDIMNIENIVKTEPTKEDCSRSNNLSKKQQLYIEQIKGGKVGRSLKERIEAKKLAHREVQLKEQVQIYPKSPEKTIKHRRVPQRQPAQRKVQQEHRITGEEFKGYQGNPQQIRENTDTQIESPKYDLEHNLRIYEATSNKSLTKLLPQKTQQSYQKPTQSYMRKNPRSTQAVQKFIDRQKQSRNSEKNMNIAPIQNNSQTESQKISPRKSRKEFRGIAPRGKEFFSQERFDEDDYMKTGAAFNRSATNLSLDLGYLDNSAGNLRKLGERSFIEKVLQDNQLLRMLKGKSNMLNKPKVMTSEERAYEKCTFKPNKFTQHSKYDKRAKPRLLNHFKDSDSISEDIEYLYENQTPSNGRNQKNYFSVSPNMSLFDMRGGLGGRDIQSPQNRSLACSFSMDRLLGAIPQDRTTKHKMKSRSNSKDFNTGALNLSLGFGGGLNDDDLNLNLGGFTSRSIDQNISNNVTLRECMESLKMGTKKPTVNFFDVKSQKKLNLILSGGYYYKYHEKKHYNANKGTRVQPKATKKINNDSVLEIFENQSRILERRDSSRSLDSTQNFYNDMFTERYKNLTKNFIENLSDVRNISQSRGDFNPSAELEKAKKNRMYKDLNINLNLKESFGSFNYNQLMDIKKLHLLYASSKARPKKLEKAKTETVSERQKNK